MTKTPKEVVECFARNMPNSDCGVDPCGYIDVCCKLADALDVVPLESYIVVDPPLPAAK